MGKFNFFDFRNYQDVNAHASNQWQVKGTNKDSLIEKLNQINIFCGENNSGKSRFLRLLHAGWRTSFNWSTLSKSHFEEHFKVLDLDIGNIQSSMGRTRLSVEVLVYQVTGLKSLKDYCESNWLNMNSITAIKELIPQIHQSVLAKRHETLKTIIENATGRYQEHMVIWFETLFNKISPTLEAFESEIQLDLIPLSSVYIPVNRGISSFNTDIHQIENSIAKQYGINDVFSGHSIGERINKALTTSAKSRQRLIRYEEYLSKLFFEGRQIFLSPDGSSVKVRIEGQTERELHHYGDGVTSIIILTFDAFFSEHSKVYFIDEPEIYLHPGLQRRFLEIISGNFLNYSDVFNRHQWFFTTHSNHLLDLTLEHSSISVFNFSTEKGQQDPIKTIQAVYFSDGGNRQIALDSLGVQASSVFRTNKLVWVEGVTDILILRTYLRYILQLRDIDYSTLREEIAFTFVFYGGANLVNFNFAEVSSYPSVTVRSICDKNFVVLDGDVKNKGNGQRLTDLQADVGKDKVMILDGKEIENTLSKEVLKGWLMEIVPKSRTLAQAQLQNHVLNNISQLDDRAYSASVESVGHYLDGLFGTKYFKSENTIRNKVELAHYVNEFKEVPYNLKGEELAKKLLDFITL